MRPTAGRMRSVPEKPAISGNMPGVKIENTIANHAVTRRKGSPSFGTEKVTGGTAADCTAPRPQRHRQDSSIRRFFELRAGIGRLRGTVGEREPYLHAILRHNAPPGGREIVAKRSSPRCSSRGDGRGGAS